MLFTRGMLDSLDRSETEAVAARLVSAIGAGDLQAATGIMAVFRTLGFFLTVLDLPLRWSAWRTLGGLLLVSVTRRTGADALGRLGEGLEEGLEADAIPDLEKIAGNAPVLVAKLVRFLLLPFYLVSIFYKLILFLWTALFLGPPMALLWRNRCYWTDARAVKLARNPEAFAKALEKIGAADPPPGGEAFAYLFIAAPTTTRRAVTDRRSLALALTPPTSKRLARLSAMGANPRGWRSRRPRGPHGAPAARPRGRGVGAAACSAVRGSGHGDRLSHRHRHDVRPARRPRHRARADLVDATGVACADDLEATRPRFGRWPVSSRARTAPGCGRVIRSGSPALALGHLVEHLAGRDGSSSRG